MLQQPKNHGTTHLFNSPILERLARTHYLVPISLFTAFSAVLLGYNFYNGLTSVPAGILVFLLGLLFWTWAEYQLHKHVFHMEPTNKVKAWIQYTFHGVHHEYPRDKTRLAMPPVASSIIVAFLFFTTRLLLGDYVFTFLPGFLIGYSAYLFVHYSIHAYVPPKNALKVLWINHSVHHYKDDNVAFGVSSPLWDVIYGTMPEKTYGKRKMVPAKA